MYCRGKNDKRSNFIVSGTNANALQAGIHNPPENAQSLSVLHLLQFEYGYFRAVEIVSKHLALAGRRRFYPALYEGSNSCPYNGTI